MPKREAGFGQSFDLSFENSATRYSAPMCNQASDTSKAYSRGSGAATTVQCCRAASDRRRSARPAPRCRPAKTLLKCARCTWYLSTPPARTQRVRASRAHGRARALAPRLAAGGADSPRRETLGRLAAHASISSRSGVLSTSSPASTHDRSVSQMLWMLLSPSTHCAMTEISPAGAVCGPAAPPVPSAEASPRSGLSRPAVATECGSVRPCARAPSRGALFLLRARMPASPASAVCSPSGVRARGAPRGGDDLARSISPALASGSRAWGSPRPRTRRRAAVRPHVGGGRPCV